MAEYLDYDGADEDLTVIVNDSKGVKHSEMLVNSVLLKMLSPWWRAKLSCSQFQDCIDRRGPPSVHISQDEPEVAALALQAARLDLTVDALVKNGDLANSFRLWQLADMWQFGYLTHICLQALRKQLLGKGLADLQQLLQPAMQHSETFLRDVLIPFFKDFEEQRTQEIYLGLGGIATVQLASAAPIQGFQLEQAFQEQLAEVSQEWNLEQLCDYMQQNVEARSRHIYASRSPDACCKLFSAAPLPSVTDMLRIALEANWTRKQKQKAIRAVDLSRMLTSDQSFVKIHHQRLPQEASIYRALWQAANRFAEHSHVSHSMATPWTFHFHYDLFASAIPSVRAGPVTLTFTTTSDFLKSARFTTDKPSYGLLWTSPRCTRSPQLLQSGKPFAYKLDWLVLIVLRDEC